MNILVGIDAALDAGTGIVTWKFTTLDPATHQFPEDPDRRLSAAERDVARGRRRSALHREPEAGLRCRHDRLQRRPHRLRLQRPDRHARVLQHDRRARGLRELHRRRRRSRSSIAPTPTARRPRTAPARGVGDAKVGKAVDKCAKTIRKVGTKLASNRLKQLGACQKAVADCVQLKPGDAACLTKAQGKCAKARTALPGAEAKLTAAIAKACGEPDGDGGESARGGRPRLRRRDGVHATGAASPGRAPSPTSPSACAGNTCARPSASLGAVVPRARELLVLGGFDPVADFALPRRQRQRRRLGDRRRQAEGAPQVRRRDPEGDAPSSSPAARRPGRPAAPPSSAACRRSRAIRRASPKRAPRAPRPSRPCRSSRRASRRRSRSRAARRSSPPTCWPPRASARGPRGVVRAPRRPEPDVRRRRHRVPRSAARVPRGSDAGEHDAAARGAARPRRRHVALIEVSTVGKRGSSSQELG